MVTLTQNKNLNRNGGCISLICPISHTKVEIPGRGFECEHPEIFDVCSMVKSLATVVGCPYCGKKFKVEDMEIDRLEISLKELIKSN